MSDRSDSLGDALFRQGAQNMDGHATTHDKLDELAKKDNTSSTVNNTNNNNSININNSTNTTNNNNSVNINNSSNDNNSINISETNNNLGDIEFNKSNTVNITEGHIHEHTHVTIVAESKTEQTKDQVSVYHRKSHKKLIISSIAILMVAVLLILFIPRLVKSIGGDSNDDTGIAIVDNPNLSELFDELDAFKATFKLISEASSLIPNFKITQTQIDTDGSEINSKEFQSINRFASFENNAYWGYKYTDDLYTDTYINETLGGQHHPTSNQSLVPLGQYTDSIAKIFVEKYFKQEFVSDNFEHYYVPDDIIDKYAINAQLGYKPSKVDLEVDIIRYSYKVTVDSKDGTKHEYKVEMNNLKDVVLPGYVSRVTYTLHFSMAFYSYTISMESDKSVSEDVEIEVALYATYDGHIFKNETLSMLKGDIKTKTKDGSLSVSSSVVVGLFKENESKTTTRDFIFYE